MAQEIHRGVEDTPPATGRVPFMRAPEGTRGRDTFAKHGPRRTREFVYWSTSWGWGCTHDHRSEPPAGGFDPGSWVVFVFAIGVGIIRVRSIIRRQGG